MDASELGQYVGYYILTSTNVVGEFEGADFDEVVKLDNGMIFEFDSYNYAYSYRPDVVILYYPWPDSMVQEGMKAGLSKIQCASYVLIIEDEIYEVARIR